MKREPLYYVYIMASRSLNLYTGVTNGIYRRALEHRRGEVEGFAKRYRIDRLVYYENFKYVGNAIRREQQIKSWTRAKRLALISSANPTWQDLAEDWGRPVKLQIPRSTTPSCATTAQDGDPRFARDDSLNNKNDSPEKG